MRFCSSRTFAAEMYTHHSRGSQLYRAALDVTALSSEHGNLEFAADRAGVDVLELEEAAAQAVALHIQSLERPERFMSRVQSDLERVWMLAYLIGLRVRTDERPPDPLPLRSLVRFVYTSKPQPPLRLASAAITSERTRLKPLVQRLIAHALITALH